MRIRSLVPALACLAAAPIAFAADSMPAVKIDGFVDSIYSITNTENAGATTGFTYAGKLGLTATISEKVAAQVDLNLSGTSGDSGASTNAITSRQTYGTWKLTDEVVLKTGKFINDIGWTAAYSPGLYRINGGPITSFYGVDQVGAHARYAKGELAASVSVANGLFGEANGATAQTTNQDNEAYALVLDAVYTRDAGSFNVELGFDEDVGTGGTDGDGHHLGLNATLTPNKELTIGAELILQAVNNKGGNEDTAHLGATVLANFKLAGSKIPMSVTGQLSYIDVEEDLILASVTDGDSFTQTEIAAALLTNPAGTDKLGANLELNYAMSETNGGDDVYSIGFAGEILYVF